METILIISMHALTEMISMREGPDLMFDYGFRMEEYNSENNSLVVTNVADGNKKLIIYIDNDTALQRLIDGGIKYHDVLDFAFSEMNTLHIRALENISMKYFRKLRRKNA